MSERVCDAPVRPYLVGNSAQPPKVKDRKKMAEADEYLADHLRGRGFPESAVWYIITSLHRKWTKRFPNAWRRRLKKIEAQYA